MRVDNHTHVSWRYVSSLEFHRWIDAFPRSLAVEPPLTRHARFRSRRDPTLGEWPANVVAKQWKIRKSCEQQVRNSISR